MRAILVRIGVDHAYGAWNAPVNPATCQFVFVPIPDGPKKTYAAGFARKYDEMDAPLTQFATDCDIPHLRRPDLLLHGNMHLDPDFEYLTYGDNGKRRGAEIAKLQPNDLLVFYAGLRSIVPPKKLLYALVGLYVVEEVVPAVTVPADRRHENAHTRWTDISASDIVVRGKRGVSGRFERCIPIGEFRDRSYRVRRDIEAAWGGLSVKNGYIQRSAVPPVFRDAAKFYGWLQHQGIKLIESNN